MPTTTLNGPRSAGIPRRLRVPVRVRTSALTGLPTSMLRPSLDAAGLELDRHTGDADVGTLLAQADGAEAWRDLYSGGHSVSGVHAVCSVAEVVERTAREFHDQ
ncbi:hypothetical protein [Nocardia brasiliensis]|uniref:hypothetical protein n=1 Tax=Nocardia brasiliensis TaxID=37326 RepID=UPI000DFD8640|nr:hypothetical protein [Nocardia brasiliensis]SUB53704.1 Uncharacterised protein [Nocardia brasiliensis]